MFHICVGNKKYYKGELWIVPNIHIYRANKFLCEINMDNFFMKNLFFFVVCWFITIMSLRKFHYTRVVPRKWWVLYMRVGKEKNARERVAAGINRGDKAFSWSTKRLTSSLVSIRTAICFFAFYLSFYGIMSTSPAKFCIQSDIFLSGTDGLYAHTYILPIIAYN